MASYHLSVKTVSRATGRSAPAAAAYRTASLIENQRDGIVHDYTRRGGVEAAFLVVPEGAAWAEDRSALWNAVEAAEKRKDAKVAREYELALPHELGSAARCELATLFAREVVSRFGVAADVAIHAPHPEGDQRNWHAHVLTTTRVVEAGGLGAKTRELDVVQTSGPAVEALRALWAVQVNVALERIQAEARVDHRSYARRGEDVVASQHLGPAASGMERRAARQQAGRDQVRAAEAWEPAQERPWAVPAPVEASQPIQGVQAAQDGPEQARAASEPIVASGPVVDSGETPRAAVRPSAGVSRAGPAPVTRIGQRNAEIQERNRVVQAAQRALEVARRALDGLERAAVAGVRRGSEGPSARKRTVRNKNTDKIPAFSSEKGQICSEIGMEWLFAACNHGVQLTLHVPRPADPPYCTQQTGGLTRGMTLRAILPPWRISFLWAVQEQEFAAAPTLTHDIACKPLPCVFAPLGLLTRRVRDLARGLGAQITGEREEQARQDAARRAEQERQVEARIAERERIAAELRQQREAARQAGPVSVQDAARAYWERLAEEGRKARQADQEREGQKPEQERARQRQGPSMGR